MNDLLSFDPEKTINNISKCINETLSKAGAKGYVIGISGGIDSAVTAALLSKSVGPNRVTGLIMPEKESKSEDVYDAKLVAEHLGIKYIIVDITRSVEEVLALFGDDYDTAPKIPKGNVKARIRMVTLYYYANKYNYLVAATGDKSEFLLGYFTKWGDGAGDIYPIINLYKTQVRRLGEYLKLPKKIINKPSSPGLWPGQTAESELGFSYDVVDQILTLLVDKGYEKESIMQTLNVSDDIVDAVIKRIKKGEHKRNPFKFCNIR